MVASKPAIDIFSGDKNLGTIFKEQNQINVKFTEFNIPLSSTTGRIASNIFGKTRIILIQGAHDGTGFDGATQNQKLADFIYEMEQWVNKSGIQDSAIFTDSFGVEYTVDAVDWMWVRSVTDPYRILYTLMMKEA